MKKAYVKPVLLIETFEPSDAIAGSCEIDVGFGDIGASKLCGYEDPDYGVVIFNDIQGGTCETQWDDGDDKGCYHIPVDGNMYFGS